MNTGLSKPPFDLYLPKHGYSYKRKTKKTKSTKKNEGEEGGERKDDDYTLRKEVYVPVRELQREMSGLTYDAEQTTKDSTDDKIECCSANIKSDDDV